VLDLDRDTAASLRLLYKLENNLVKMVSSQKIITMRTSIAL
jgi:hypothetical protein